MDPILDIFFLDTHDARLVAIGDSSSYPPGFHAVSPTIEIKMPGQPLKSMSFVPGSIQVYNSVSLGLNCDPAITCPLTLPDGLYKVSYSIYPAFQYFVTKHFMNVSALYEKYDRAFLKLDILQCDVAMKTEDRKILDEVEDYIQGAIVAANQCAEKLAIDSYNKACKLLDNYLDNRHY